MAAKKTTPVLDLINYTNDQLRRNDAYATQEFKAGICTMLEQVLFVTNNYKGFTFNKVNANADEIKVGGYEYFNRTYITNNKLTK